MQKIIDRIIAATFLKVIPQSVTPNSLTWTRFFLTPFVFFFLLIHMYGLGIIVLGLALLTDAIDGALARTRGQITEWGQLYDPVADKLLVGGTALIILPQFVGWLIPGIIVILEVGIIFQAWHRKKTQERVISAKWEGKLKMIFQSAALLCICVFIFYPLSILLLLAQLFFWLAILLATLSLFVYRTI
ncbi:MAG: CDP-alcohol phosphatidyltransferase family protein [Candidatus Pacebacteria bacterium]|nr:CDP-alcohol phosphatidyltransferase family protein [Candidatus Paceibacterota bacterium]